MSATDAADEAFFVDDQTKLFREVIIDAVATCAGVDQSADTLHRQVWLAVIVHRSAKTDIDL